jgi:hypothetical protein
MRKLSAISAAFVLAVAVASPVAAAVGPPHLGLIVGGVEYRTVGTPTDLSGTGAPASTFDLLYAVEGQALAVAAAAPGDSDYNGGRWMRFAVTWNTTPYPLESEEDVLDAADAGDVTIASTPDAQFVCPVIPA